MKHGAGVPSVWAPPSCRRVFLCVLDVPVCSVRVTQPPVVLLCTRLLTSVARPGRGVSQHLVNASLHIASRARAAGNPYFLTSERLVRPGEPGKNKG